MEAKDLRPLNYFQDENGEIYQLKKIEFEEDEIDFTLTYGNGTSGEYLWKDEAEPIEITEDWLRKFGFTIGASESESAYYHKMIDHDRLCLRFYRNVKGVVLCLGMEENSSYKMKYYIHELQNFYYFLCGEELVLK